VPLMKECMPKEFDNRSLADLQVVTKSFNAVDTALWGECEGACYVRQVRVYSCRPLLEGHLQFAPFCGSVIGMYQGNKLSVLNSAPTCTEQPCVGVSK
jgi:hypothetical protein